MLLRRLSCVASQSRILTGSAVGIHLPQAVEELENALVPLGAKVYVHCTAGINRGPTLAAAYLIKADGLTAQEAYSYVIARRDCSPYLDTLQEYEAYLKRKRLALAIAASN